MTAIYGLWRFDDGDVEPDFRRLDQALQKYGNDDHWTSAPNSRARMGRHLHRSLAEDMFQGDPAAGRYVVAGDVRLTEREDLARQLNLGSEVENMSDAAIAAAAIEAWNEQAFDRIYGVFAIAAWDTQEQRLLLARDHIGHKPLFFHSADDFFAFASMPEGLHALPNVPRGPDVESAKRVLANQNESPGRTHFEGIGRVMPGHYAIVTAAGIVQYRYWKPNLDPLRLPRHEDYVSALAERLDRAVAAALRGTENKVGAHLSCGFDTTAVATSAAIELARRGGTVVAYTAAPREGYAEIRSRWINDESRLAKMTADMHPNMEHVIIRPDRNPLQDVDRTSSIYGMPVPNLCNEAWYDAINDDARRRGLRVILEGFFGNATISETGILALPELVRRGRMIAWAKLVTALIRKRSSTVRAIIWESVSPWLPDGVYRRLIDRRYGALVSLRRFSALKDEHLQKAARDAARESPIPGALDRVLKNGWSRWTSNSLYERLTILAPDYVGASHKGILGRWKIDYRDPTADRRLVEFSLRVPAEELIHGGERRALLRKVLADRAPAEVLESDPLKGLQSADWHEWFSQSRDYVRNEIARIEMFEPTAEIMDVERLKTLVEEWPSPDSDAWTEWSTAVDYRWCILRAISVASFMRQAARSNY